MFLLITKIITPRVVNWVFCLSLNKSPFQKRGKYTMHHKCLRLHTQVEWFNSGCILYFVLIYSFRATLIHRWNLWMALSLKKGRKTRKRKKDKFRRRTNLSKDDYSSIRKGGGGGAHWNWFVWQTLQTVRQ